jgi:hypothetical protein
VLEQQGDHVSVALLCGQVQRGEAVLGLGVGLRAVLDQRGRDVHLVLLGRDVQGRVAVLGGKRKRRNNEYSSIYQEWWSDEGRNIDVERRVGLDDDIRRTEN